MCMSRIEATKFTFSWDSCLFFLDVLVRCFIQTRDQLRIGSVGSLENLHVFLRGM